MKHRKLKNSELERLSTDDFKKVRKIPVVVVLDNIRSLNNIGSVFRTADAFLIEKIMLCGITATPPHKDITKTALGATESVDWEYALDTLELIAQLRSQGYKILAIEQAEGSTSLANVSIETSSKYALIFGNEVKGVQQSVVSASDMVVEIPQYGTKHSLNISVSTGVVLWEVFRNFNEEIN